ncbi:MAG: hotdog fold thioesterase [Candidatus Latescibacter sp.]|nr:hotdog fold thioesterase [Candidatus Latescibacter sp.]
MENLVTFFETDVFARYLGVELLEASEGRAKARLEIRPHHLNSHAIVHGGVLFGLADVVFAVASNSYGVAAVAIHADISYFKATSEGVLTAEAKELSRSAKLASYTIHISDDKGKIVAAFQGMVYRKEKRSEGKQK